jgi:hypothetical protein
MLHVHSSRRIGGFLTSLHYHRGIGPSIALNISADTELDRRIRNKAKLKAFDLVDPRNTELRTILQKAEYALTAGNDLVQDDDEDDGPTGSASDSE